MTTTDPTRHWWQRRPLVAAVRLEGVIAAGRLRGQLCLQAVERPLQAAFRLRRATEVALLVNSPGGAPVQAAMIHDRIRWLARHHGKRVTAFVEDVAASGGYWIALAADEIVAAPSSIVGSIGVISAGFGFDRALQRLGIERRVHATGPHKAMLDPFRPERAEDVAILNELHSDIFAQFRDLVQARRGARLDPAAPLFDGRVLTGRQALAAGLVDAVGDANGVLRSRYGDAVRLRTFQPARLPWWRQLRGESGLEALLGDVERRLLDARYGL